MGDQKKRALDAIERRFAAAKAQAEQQLMKKGKRKSFEPNHQHGGFKKKPFVASSSPSTVSVSSVQPSPAFVQHSSSKKANIADTETEGLTYSRICHPVHEKLLNNVEISSKEKTVVDDVLHELLRKGDSAQKYIQGSRSVKIDNWILLDNFVQGNSSALSRLRSFKAKSKRSKAHMSMKQLKKCGSLDMPKEFHKFELYLPMHEMWKEYVLQLLRNVGKDHVAQCILGADLHGAIIRVIECKTKAFIGVVGIMVRETAETFGIVSQENHFRVVPKKNSIFVLQAHCWKITLQGNKLISRASAS